MRIQLPSRPLPMPHSDPVLSSILANDFSALWQEIGPDALAAIQRVGQSGWWVLGPEVQRFESALAQAWGLAEAVGCGNGLDAIEIALRAGGLRPGEWVMTTPLSAFATTLGILRAGGVPLFVDVDRAGLIDLKLVEAALHQHPEVRWLVPVHLYGQCLNLTELTRLKETYSLQVVEDCAQSIGATWSGQPCGSVGRAAATSFYPTKNLGAMGDGGALLTNDAALATAARQWRNYGQSEKYFHALPGLNSRLDEVQAAILHDALLPRWERFTQSRREIAACYRAGLQHPMIKLLPIAPEGESVYHLFPIFIQTQRASFLHHLHQHGIVTGIHYPKLIPDQAAMHLQTAHRCDSLKMAEGLAEQEVSLPIHPHLTPSQVQHVIATCNSWTA